MRTLVGYADRLSVLAGEEIGFKVSCRSPTYHADIVRYYEALEKASPRVKLFRIGKSEEGRDMVALAIADEATIKQLDKYQAITAKLTDPRKLKDDAETYLGQP